MVFGVSRTMDMRRLQIPISCFVGLLVLVSWSLGTLEAKTFTHKEGGLRVFLPDFWGVEEKGGVIVTSPRDGSLLLLFGIVPQNSLQQALKELDKHLLKFVKSPRIEGKPVQVVMNEMCGFSVGASGEMEGKRVEISVMLLDTNAPTIFLVLGLGEKGKFEKHVPVVKQILGTLQGTLNPSCQRKSAPKLPPG